MLYFNLTQLDILQVATAFLGAFFAFCFMMFFEKNRRGLDLRKKCINEHVYLERYFNHVLRKLDVNFYFIKHIKSNFKIITIEITRFQEIPLNSGAEMNLIDLIFLNKYHVWLMDLIQLNESIKNFNLNKERINNHIEKYIIENDDNNQKKDDNQKKFVKKSMENFCKELDILQNCIKMTKDDLKKLCCENRALIKYYKPSFLSRFFSKIYSIFTCPLFFSRDKEIEICKKEYEKELEQTFNDSKEKYKDYGII